MTMKATIVDQQRRELEDMWDRVTESEESYYPGPGSWFRDPDASFDHILDAFPLNEETPVTKLCECCQNLVGALGRVQSRSPSTALPPALRSLTGAITCLEQSGHDFMHYTSFPGPLALKDSAEAGCALCSVFLSSIQLIDGEDPHVMISEYVDKWRAKFGEADLPYPRRTLDDMSTGVPLNIQLDFPLSTTEEPFEVGLKFNIKLRKSAKSRKSL